MFSCLRRSDRRESDGMGHVFSSDNEKQEFKWEFCGEVDKLVCCASKHKFRNDVLEPGRWVLLTEWNC